MTSSRRWRYCSEPINNHSNKYDNNNYPELDLNQTTLNIITLGRTGDGKSSLLNDLVGKQAFEQKISAKSQTKEIQSIDAFWAPLNPYLHDKENFGCPIHVIDTPGFADSQNRDDEFFTMIQHTLVDTAINYGIHCILLVFKITTSSDTIYKTIDSFYNLISPHTTTNDYWKNVLLVFTHADVSHGHTNRFQSQKVALKQKVNRTLKEKYHLDFDLPMLWISTQKYVCGYLKGLGDCDCETGHRYHSDCRRRLYEQVVKRRHIPFCIMKDSGPVIIEDEE